MWSNFVPDRDVLQQKIVEVWEMYTTGVDAPQPPYLPVKRLE